VQSAAWIALAAAGAFVYHRLVLFDPNLYSPSEVGPVEDWFFSPQAASPVLIYALTFWFVVRRAPRLSRDRMGIGASLLGASGLFAAMGLVLWGHYTLAFQVLPPSLALSLISGGLLLGGFDGGRLLLMPALFVLLMGTPIPPPVLNRVLYPMQLMTAEVSVAVVRWLGFAVQQLGEQIVTPWATFQVIETCAGLRAMQTLVMAAFVYGELLDLHVRRRVILIGIAPVLGLVINLLRVLLLVFNPVPESQPEHTWQGIGMIVIGVLALWGVDEGMDFLRGGRQEHGQGDSQSGAQGSLETAPQAGRVGALAAVLALVGVSSLAVEPWTPTPLPGKSVHAISRELDGWKMGQETIPVDDEYLGSVRFSSRTWRLYGREGMGRDEWVSLFAGMNDRVLRSRGLVSPKTLTLEAGSVVLPEPRERLESGGSRGIERVVRTRRGQTWLVHHWYEETAGFWAETWRSMWALDRGPWRRKRPSRVYRIATPLEPSTGGLEGARARLRDFSGALRRELAKLNEAG
jgi:exosortase